MSDIDDWEIFLLGGAFVIGLPNEDKTKLAPIFQLIRAPSNTGVNMAVVPLAFFHEWREAPYPPGVPTLRVKDISKHEKEGLRQGIQKCEGIVNRMRLESSGIALPPGFNPDSIG